MCAVCIIGSLLTFFHWLEQGFKPVKTDIKSKSISKPEKWKPKHCKPVFKTEIENRKKSKPISKPTNI